MPKGRRKNAEKKPAPIVRLESVLFKSADRMRGSMDPSEYKHVALGLVFLRYLSVAFERKREALAQDQHADIDDKDEYLGDGVFWVPDEARWSGLRDAARARHRGTDRRCHAGDRAGQSVLRCRGRCARLVIPSRQPQTDRAAPADAAEAPNLRRRRSGSLTIHPWISDRCPRARAHTRSIWMKVAAIFGCRKDFLPPRRS